MTGYKKYPEYKDSGVEWLGKIPVDWDVFKLRRSVSTINGGAWGEEPDIQEETIRCVRVADFDRHNSSIHSRNPTTRSYLKNEIIKKAAHDGDLIIEKSGGGEKTPVGNVVLYRGSIPIMYSNFVCKVSLSEGQNSAFWCYMHKTLYGYGINLRSIKQNTGIQNLDIDSYFDEKVCFPPLATQHKIVSFLDAETKKIDASVASMESLISLLTEKRTALISETVTRGIPGEHTEFKDSGVEWLGEIPISYSLVNTGRVLRTKKELVGNLYDSFQLLSLTKKGIISRDINSGIGKFPESFDTYQAVHPGDLVFCLFDTEETPRTVGLVKQEGMITGAYTRFEVSPKLANQEFLEKYFIAIDDKKGFKPLYTGLRKTIQKPRFLASKVALPTLEEQHRIVRFLNKETNKIDIIINEAKESIKLLKEKRQALISEAVTGKIDVTSGVNSRLVL